MTSFVIVDVVSFGVFLHVEKYNSNSQLQNSLGLLNKIEQNITTQSKQFQSLSSELDKLKKDVQNLNQKLSKELVFREALRFILAAEGGISNDKNDSGGLTKFGITHTEYYNYRAKKGLAQRSVRLISPSEAQDIYKHYYWENSGCDYPPRRIAIACLDWQVNSGRGFSTLQASIGVKPDAIVGHQTLNELNYWLAKGKETELLHNYFDIRENDYRRWGVGSQRVFLQGWMSRAEALKKYLHV
ncbi:MAG: glycoside hydrolase family 108 protein [Nostoc sp.]